MHQFPPDFNKESCQKIIQISHDELMANCRKSIYDHIIKQSNKRSNTITLSFPYTIEKDNRIILCGELMERFGNVEIKFNLKEKGSSYPMEYSFSDFNVLKTFISERNTFGIAIDSLKLNLNT